MARRSKREEPEALRRELVDLLNKFEIKLKDENLREQVNALVPANYLLRDLGSSLIREADVRSASSRILAYMRKYPATLLKGDELMVVAGISEYARRIRELRVQMGWPIFSGQALIDMDSEGECLPLGLNVNDIRTDTYLLLENKQDRDSAYRWNVANDIRKSSLSVKDKLLAYLRRNVGKEVTGEELKYLAKDKSEWARRVRELRTEDGWPILTKNTGRPDLKVGVYLLEEDRQAKVHDRRIPDPVRVRVLERDSFSCCWCGWSRESRRIEDSIRNLIELHHIEHHAKGGLNVEENLICLCNVCHDEVHRGGISGEDLRDKIS